MDRFSITTNAHFSGEWWISGAADPPTKISGTLAWSNKRATLELNDSFTPLSGAIFGDEHLTYPAIHGTTTKGSLVTVIEAIGAGFRLGVGSAGLRQPSRFASSLLIVGDHVEPDALYSVVETRIPGLQIWLGRSGIAISMEPAGEAPGPVFTYRIEQPPDEVIEIPIIQASIAWGLRRDMPIGQLTKIDITTHGCLRIEPEEPQTLTWYLEQLGKSTTLLSFIAGSPMASDHFAAKVAATGRNTQILVALRESTQCPFESAHNFYMLEPALGTDLRVVLNKWFDLYETVATPSQLALSVLVSDHLWPHVEFLSLMQALEGFHRAVLPGLYTSEEKYKVIHDAMLSAIPESIASDHRASLKSRVRFGNEISLRKRLNALVDRLGLPLRQRIFGSDGQLPQSWVDTRNYYTHWDETSRHKALDGMGMHVASVRLRHLLRALYLQMVDVPQPAIAAALDGTSRESQYLIQLNAREHRQRNPGSQVGALMHIGVADAESPEPLSAKRTSD